jgi:hypothetical protein
MTEDTDLCQQNIEKFVPRYDVSVVVIIVRKSSGIAVKIILRSFLEVES